MHITQSQKTEKFTITGLTFDDLVRLFILFESRADSIRFFRECSDMVYQALLESLDEDEIKSEYGYAIEKSEYLKHYLGE